jgi:Opioid growth factor receptor (OGFr) conserved region
MDSKIVNFYSGEAPDHRGRFLHHIQEWDDARLESVHDYIQWLFPLTERSGFNPAAPVLTPDVIKVFRSREDLQQNLRQSFIVMLRFYGLEIGGTDEVVRGRDFETKAENWLSASNHNHLRITRILKSLTLLGLEAEARAFFECLAQIYEEEERKPEPAITAETLAFWGEAVNEARVERSE